MKKFSKTLAGSLITFIVGTSCCWMAPLLGWLGGATLLTVISKFTESHKTPLLSLAAIFLIIGLYQFWKHKKKTS